MCIQRSFYPLSERQGVHLTPNKYTVDYARNAQKLELGLECEEVDLHALDAYYFKNHRIRKGWNYDNITSAKICTNKYIYMYVCVHVLIRQMHCPMKTFEGRRLKLWCWWTFFCFIFLLLFANCKRAFSNKKQYDER